LPAFGWVDCLECGRQSRAPGLHVMAGAVVVASRHGEGFRGGGCGKVSHLYREEFRVCFVLYSQPSNREMGGGSGSGILDRMVGI
jgi:hypothetical protein